MYVWPSSGDQILKGYKYKDTGRGVFTTLSYIYGGDRELHLAIKSFHEKLRHRCFKESKMRFWADHSWKLLKVYYKDRTTSVIMVRYFY